MPKRFILLILILVLLLFVKAVPSFANDTPTPLPSSTGQPTCDMCGWCNRLLTPPAPSPANWVACNTCFYPTPGQSYPQPNSYYTVFGCLSTEPGRFVASILSIVFSISGGIAFLAILGGSAIVLTSTGDPERLQFGKDMVTSSIFGLLLIIFSVFLLHFVGYDVLRIPGFG